MRPACWAEASNSTPTSRPGLGRSTNWRAGDGGVPASGRVSPTMILKVVDFPAPYGAEEVDHLEDHCRIDQTPTPAARPSPAAGTWTCPTRAEVGVLLDASAQHAGRTGRETLTVAQRSWACPAGASRRCWSGRPHPGRGVPAGRRLLARDAPTARDRDRADRGSGGADPRRAGQRPGPGRASAGCGPAPGLRGRRRHRPALLPPPPRDRGDRRRHRDDRQGQDRPEGTKTELLHAAGTVVRAADLARARAAP